MIPLRILPLCLIAVMHIAVGFAIADDEKSNKERPPLKERIDALLKADSRHAFAEASTAIFEGTSQKKIEQLQAHQHPTVALAAAWERVRRTVPKEDWTHPVRPDALNRFLGFVEGRLRVNLPRHFERAFLKARAHRRDNIHFLVGTKDDRWPYVRGDEIWRHFMFDVEKKEDAWHFGRGNASVSIPNERVEESGAVFGDAVNAAFTDRYAYVALHGTTPVSYPLFCVDVETNQVVWDADVLAGNSLFGFTGRSWQEVYFVVEKDCVLLFGISGTAAYIEGFTPDTGELLFRFGTRYQ